MAYFPKLGPFYDPKNEQELYGERDGRLRLRHNRDDDHGYGENGVKYEYGARPTNDSTQPIMRKKDSGWTEILQDHGNLFYLETNRHTERKPDPRGAPRKLELNNNHNHSRQNSYSSDTNESPRTNQSRRYMKISAVERQYSADNESLGSSGSSLLNERHIFDRNNVASRFNRDDRQRCSDGSSQSDHSYTTFSEYLETNNGPPRTSQKRHITQSNQKVTTGTSLSPHLSMNQGQSGKRKSIVMVPNLKYVTDVYSCSGVVLCEKLFGIKLCNYKDKPPRPNGSSVDQILRDRKVIVQGVVQDSQADVCSQIHRGDMLVGMNDVNVTWVNIDEMIRTMSLQPKVKLTFQVPLVIGPKQSTPPVTPTQNTPPLSQHTDQSRVMPPPLSQHTDQSRVMPPPLSQHTDQSRIMPPPPLPPHLPIQPPSVPPRQPRTYKPRQHLQDLVHLTTGETVMSLDSLLRKHLFCVMYLTLGSQSDGYKDDVLYQYPAEDNKLVEIRGLFVTLTAMMKDVTHNYPTSTCVRYRDQNIHTVYWRHNQDVLVFCLPENRVPVHMLCKMFTDFTQILQWQHGSVARVFEDKDFHGQLDQLISLILYRVLLTGVTTHSIPVCSPLEPHLFDSLAGIRWLPLTHDDKILCDEILSEFEAQDFMEIEDVDPDVRRKFGILGSCLFYKDYLLCSHLYDADLEDVHLFLKYHAILYLVNKQPVEDLMLWREIYPSRIYKQPQQKVPAYKEPNGRWFILVVSMRHFLHCTILECGGYASPIQGKVEMDQFILDQSKTTLAQLMAEDTDMEQQCNERLFSELHGPKLKSVDNQSHGERTPIKSALSKSDSSPRYVNDESDRLSIHSPEGGLMRRQGSRISRSSNDSNGSSGSAGINKNTPLSKKGSMYDVSPANRSFTESRTGTSLKVTRSSDNLLLHYVSFNKLTGVYVSPTPCDLSTVQGPTHQHVLYNFYGCCLKIHKQFECIRCKQKQIEGSMTFPPIEEAVMFTCQVSSSQDTKRPPVVIMYWVIGRLFGDDQELYVCIEDGAPQSMLELAFNYQLGLS